MKDDELEKRFWTDWRQEQTDEQRFHIHYSAAGLGLLMTLQTFRIPGTAEGVAGPKWMWITAIVSFALCLLLSGWSYWWNAAYHYAFLEDRHDTGRFRCHSGWEMFLTGVDWCVRASFATGVLASAAYFICQRA